MNQIDYQPAAFNPALAFSPQQSQIHSHGGLQQPFLSRNPSAGPQAFGQAPYPSQGSPNQHNQQNAAAAAAAARGFGMASTGFNPSAAMMQQQQQLSCKCLARLPSPAQHVCVCCKTYTSSPCC